MEFLFPFESQYFLTSRWSWLQFERCCTTKEWNQYSLGSATRSEVRMKISVRSSVSWSSSVHEFYTIAKVDYPFQGRSAGRLSMHQNLLDSILECLEFVSRVSQWEGSPKHGLCRWCRCTWGALGLWCGTL